MNVQARLIYESQVLKSINVFVSVNNLYKNCTLAYHHVLVCVVWCTVLTEVQPCKDHIQSEV